MMHCHAIGDLFDNFLIWKANHNDMLSGSSNC